MNGRHISPLARAIIIVISCGGLASAQQMTGVPGSPSATTTIDGKQLPNSVYVIKESAKDSKPFWPPSVVPPKGAPTVLLIMTDDQGYGVSGYDSVFGQGL
jgi:arylsulfatase